MHILDDFPFVLVGYLKWQYFSSEANRYNLDFTFDDVMQRNRTNDGVGNRAGFELAEIS